MTYQVCRAELTLYHTNYEVLKYYVSVYSQANTRQGTDWALGHACT
jgi:hypothetical protein